MDLVDEAIARLIQADGAGLQRFLERLDAGRPVRAPGARGRSGQPLPGVLPALEGGVDPGDGEPGPGGAPRRSGHPLRQDRPQPRPADRARSPTRSSSTSSPVAPARRTARICASTPCWRPSSWGCRPASWPRTTWSRPGRIPEDVTVALLQSALRRTVDGDHQDRRAGRGGRVPRPCWRGRHAAGARSATTAPTGAPSCQRQDDDGRRVVVTGRRSRQARSGGGAHQRHRGAQPRLRRTVAMDRPRWTAGLDRPERSPRWCAARVEVSPR